MPHYFVSGGVASLGKQKVHQIVEETEKGQVIIALCPFNPNHRDGWALARKDALMIVEALNQRSE